MIILKNENFIMPVCDVFNLNQLSTFHQLVAVFFYFYDTQIEKENKIYNR